VVVGIAVLITLLVLPAAGALAASPSATYSFTQTIPVPPASSYTGSGGGDGWALAMTPTAVYNVFHHSSTLQVACHLQADASPCWAPKTITDASSNGFSTSGQPGLWLDQTTGHLFVYATRPSDASAGVVCIDTTQPAANPDPFCGFTVLAPSGAAPANSGVSDPALVGTRWYAFNYVDGAPAAGAQNALLCFDTATDAACAGQPFAVSFGGGSVSASDPSYRAPAVAAISTDVMVPVNGAGGEVVACFDGTTNTPCSGSWPAPVNFAYSENYGAAFPTLSPAGVTTGLCLPAPGLPCFDLSGAPVPTPTGLSGAIGAGTAWNGPAFTLGPRIYVPNGNIDEVQCFDFSTGASCANFPKSLPGLGFLYSVNPDPQRANCVWVNADNGTGQIQNFDAYTGGACGQGPIRVLASSIVVPTAKCMPTGYTSLKVDQPARSGYVSGSVSFLDGDGSPIPGAADEPLDGTGTVALTGLDLNTPTGLPEFLITLVGASGAPAAVVVTLVWTGVDDPSCVKPGTTVTGGATHYQIDMKAWIPQASVVDPEQPISLPYALSAIIHSPCHKPSIFLIPFTSVSTRYHGDGHTGFAGSYRVLSSLEFDWDGTQILDASVPPGPHFGESVLMGTYSTPFSSTTCELKSGTASQSTGFTASGSSFSVTYSAKNPVVRLPAPTIDGTTTGTIAADGTINLHYKTDLFPSHGIQVIKNGVPQLTDIVNDASCLPNFAVTGFQGAAVIAGGLLIEADQGNLTIQPGDDNLTGKSNTALCLGL
jgi:hypothetical protein